MKAIGVLCTRVRVEEKQIIAAVGVAGFAGVPVLPPSTPVPPGPASLDLATLGIEEQSVVNGTTLDVMIDRYLSRQMASVMIPTMRALGMTVIDAGLVAQQSRLDVARALNLAGIPRPQTLVSFSEESGVAAARELGFPVTILPLRPGEEVTYLLDRDTADAVIEHRVVLGREEEAIALLQAGAPLANERTLVHVIGGRAVGFDGVAPTADAIAIAERAAKAVHAGIVGVDLATIGGELVVWDMQPVPDFRKAQLLGEQTVAEAIAAHAGAIANGTSGVTGVSSRAAVWETEVRHDVVLSA